MTRQEIKDAIFQTVSEEQTEFLLPNFDLSQVTVERSGDRKFSDYSSNVALKIAPLAKKRLWKSRKLSSAVSKRKFCSPKLRLRRPGLLIFICSKNICWSR